MRKNCSGQFFLLPNRIFDERLSPNEFIVYSFLVRAKDSAGQSFWSVPMIAKSCSMCASTCRKVLHSLESGGYIMRETTESDSRTHRVTITKKGRSVIERSEQMFWETEKAMFEGFSEEEMQSLQQFLERIYENLLRDQQKEE